MEKPRQDAISAFRILNYMTGDLVASSQIRNLFHTPIFEKTASKDVIGCANHMCFSYLFLTLCKCQEFYEKFHATIPDDCRAEFKALTKEIHRRRIMKLRNNFVGHIWNKKTNQALTNAEIEVAVSAITDDDPDGFINWCNTPGGNEYPKTVVSIIERTRNRIGEDFKIKADEIGG